MKCIHCGAGLKSTRGAHRYRESGLSNVTLLNVELRTCAACGDREVVIPKIEHLHKVIAQAVSLSPARLRPEEIRVLRKWLGFSAADFARVMGVRPETVSRWENTDGTYPMPPTAERLVRLMVSNQDPTTTYPIDLFQLQPKTKPEPLRFRGPDWTRAAA